MARVSAVRRPEALFVAVAPGHRVEIKAALSGSGDTPLATFLDSWQQNGKAGAVAARDRAGAYPHRSLVFLHDPVYYPQSQASAFFTLGGEKGLEDAAAVLAGNSAASFGNGDAHRG